MTNESDETTPGTQPQPSGGRRVAAALGRFLTALFKVVVVLTLIAAVGVASYLIIQELRRSFNVVNGRVDDTLEQALDTRSELGTIEQRLTGTLSEQESRLLALEANVATTLPEELARQNDMLNQQEAMLSAMSGQLSAMEEEAQSQDGLVTLLNEDLIALQDDLGLNSSALDELGSALDTVVSDNDNVAAHITELQDTVNALPLEDIERMRQVVTLFRVWETVGRARFRLLENNAGLATTDAAQALAALQAVAADARTEPDLLSDLVVIQARLTLAENNLPDNPAQAALDLEGAWSDLDLLLAQMLGLEPAPVTLAPATPTPGADG